MKLAMKLATPLSAYAVKEKEERESKADRLWGDKPEADFNAHKRSGVTLTMRLYKPSVMQIPEGSSARIKFRSWLTRDLCAVLDIKDHRIILTQINKDPEAPHSTPYGPVIRTRNTDP